MDTMKLQRLVPVWFVQAPLEAGAIRRQIAAVRQQGYGGILPVIITPEIKNATWLRDGLYIPCHPEFPSFFCFGN